MKLIPINPILFLAAISAAGLTGCTRSINDIAPTSGPGRLPSAPVEAVQSANNLPPPVNGQQAGYGQNTGYNNSGVINGVQQNSGQIGGLNQPRLLNARPVVPTAPTAPSTNIAAAPAAEASTMTAETAAPITREAVSGTWQVSSDSSSCRMILAFTKWQGGYRAATRKCTSPELGSISAWDVKGKQVILMDAKGNAIGQLYRSGKERYDGTTNNGASIVFTRS